MKDLITLVNLIDAILPQTQCTKCGYEGCKPYAEAIAVGDAINKCPPGGQKGIAQLAALLNKPVIPLDTTHGEEPTENRVAFIREAECIGCTKCIQACPVDAILGAAKLMHTVISDICTGCDLCVAPCPVDCIDMVLAPAVIYPDEPSKIAAEKIKADLSRRRFRKRNARLQQLEDEKQFRRQARDAQHEKADNNKIIRKTKTDPDMQSRAALQARVQAALETVRTSAAAQPIEEQRAKLERALASARERLERAELKIQQARKKTPEQLSMLCARREDMRFKLDEATRKLAELDTNNNNESDKKSRQYNDALSRITFLRNQKTDASRLANGLTVIQQKLATARAEVIHASGEEKLFLQEDIERLQKKLAEAEKTLAELASDENDNNNHQP